MRRMLNRKLSAAWETWQQTAAEMKEQQMQAEYQTHLKEQYYLDQMKKDKEESQASLEGANERLEGVKRTKEAQGREASEAMQAMEVAHMRAAEELEKLREKLRPLPDAFPNTM